MNKVLLATLIIAPAIVALLAAVPASAQWAAEPGATMRNAFGPMAGHRANQCRGACGADCPDTCTKTVSFECMDASRLRRVVTYDCDTHRGCRAHDDCLDTCLQKSASGGVDGSDCGMECDVEVMQQFGFESSASWLMGGGPYDGRISFSYTRDAPDALEPAYRCPSGASRQCAGDIGCAMTDGTRVEPVFDAYPDAGVNAMHVTAFRYGPACGDGVCEQSADIQVTGSDACAGGDCTRFGMEFDYRDADPSAPLECSTSTSGGEDDFVGDLLKQSGDAMTSRGANSETQGEDGMAELLGMFGKVLASGDSPEDINISIAPLDADGNPIESQRVGSTSGDSPRPIPNSIDLPAANGHLFVPMYQLAGDLNTGQIKERRVRCTHKGAPVLETVFRLHAN